MNKILLYLSLSAFFISTVNFAQEKQTSLKEELLKVKAELKELHNQVTENTEALKEQLAYIEKQAKKIKSYERSLKLMESVHEARLDKLVFNITDVVGNQEENSLKFEGFVVNEGNKAVILERYGEIEYFDSEANRVKGHILNFGDEHSINLLPGVATRFSVDFHKIPAQEAAKISALSIGIRHGFSRSSIVFKNMDVDWEE